MNELIRLARALRYDPVDSRHAFTHRVGVGLVIAALILMLSILFNF